MTEERDTKRVFFYVGIACGIAVSSSFASWSDGGLSFLSRRPLIAALLGFGMLLIAALVCLRQREYLGALGPVALVPMIIGTAVNRSAGHAVEWAQALRVLSVVLVFSIAIGVALFRSSRFRELERFLFTKATSAAFFITVVGAAVYGLVGEFMKIPQLSFVWVSVFGLVTWVFLAWIFEKRYS